VLSAWVVALTLLVWGAPPATAGGLTSVLVVSPESMETASLYYSDSAYQRLERLLGGGPDGGTDGGTDSGTTIKPPEANLIEARQINVTWLAHDISPVRIDRIHLASDGPEAWIHTSRTPPDWNGTWHRSPQPEALRALLDELGVTGEAVDPETIGAQPPAGGSAPGPEDGQPVTEPRTAATPPAAGDQDWWWALPGLALGLIAGYAGSLLIRRAATRQKAGPPRGQPRQELIDL
jgi:hypothetical protein